MSGHTDTLDTEYVNVCPLCGSEDKEVLYLGLRDRLFDVLGEWTYKKCPHCEFIFLDPRPTVGDLGKAYATYPTHASLALSNSLPRRLRSYAERGYLASKLGYTKGVGSLQRLAGHLIYLHPGQREYVESSVMYLPASRRGRVLDVGCGAGKALNDLRQLGWRAEGVEPDARAVENAVSRYGLDVRQGLIEEQGYPSNYFDAVTMSHVIEHVHDPVSLLKECRRVLKPGGLLVVATPNADSLGHRLFGRRWRVLEVPRHLTVFSSSTLRRTANKAGFTSMGPRTTCRGANGIFIEGRRMRSDGASIGLRPPSISEKLMGYAYQYAVSFALHILPHAGEEVLMTATKDHRTKP